MKSKIITIASQKGGVGKTTTAVNLAHGLALKGRQVLVIDVDPQAQCATVLGLEQSRGVFNLLIGGLSIVELLQPTGRKGLYLLPGSKRTATAQLMMTHENPGRMDLLYNRLVESLPNGSPDYIILDTAPSVGGLQEMALWAADLVIIPSATDSMATDGVAAVIATLESLIENQNWQGAVLGVLPTFYDEVTNESKTVLADLRRSLGLDRVLEPIHRATVLRECPAHGKTIFEFAPRSRAADEYAALTWRVLDVP